MNCEVANKHGYKKQKLRHNDCKDLINSSDVAGLAHNGQLCRFFGALWIPERWSATRSVSISASAPARSRLSQPIQIPAKNKEIVKSLR